MQVIYKQLNLLCSAPDIGRLVEDYPGQRELVIPFGDSGYLARYRYSREDDAVYVVAFKHQLEDSY